MRHYYFIGEMVGEELSRKYNFMSMARREEIVAIEYLQNLQSKVRANSFHKCLHMIDQIAKKKEIQSNPKSHDNRSKHPESY